MTISEFISELEKIKSEHGDLNIYSDPSNNEYTALIYDEIDFRIGTMIPYAIENGEIKYQPGIVIY